MTNPSEGPEPRRADPLARLGDWLVAAILVGMGYAAWLTPLPGEPDAGPASGRIQRVTLVLLALVSAFLWLQLRAALRSLRRMDELLTDVRFGSGTRRDRDAVDILVRALRAPDEKARETALRTLRKISGIDLGADPGPWETWWKAARSTFVRPGPQPGKK